MWGKKIPNLDESLHQEYADSAAELVKLRREAKVNGNFFVEPEAVRKGMMVWESIMAIQSKWQETHPLFDSVVGCWLFVVGCWLFGMKLLFCNSTCNILILLSGLTGVGEPCTCSCQLRGQASFCRSHCGNH